MIESTLQFTERSTVNYTPEQLWFRLSSKRGLWDFWEKRHQLQNLTDTERDRFYLHDVRNILNSVFLGINLYTLEGDYISNNHNPIFRDMNIDNLEMLVNAMKKLPERSELHLNEIGLDGSNEFAERILKKIPLLKNILPQLVDSINFLNHPSGASFKKLLAKEITLQELASFFDARVNQEPSITMVIPEVSPISSSPEISASSTSESTSVKMKEPEILLSGFEVNVIYNLLQNAEKFHRNWQEKMEKMRNENPIIIYYSPESIIIVNRSTEGLSEDDNQDIFKLGVHGKNGNTGYGLVISSLNAAVLGLKMKASSKQVGENDHIVTFEVMKDPNGYRDYFK